MWPRWIDTHALWAVDLFAHLLFAHLQTYILKIVTFLQLLEHLHNLHVQIRDDLPLEIQTLFSLNMICLFPSMRIVLGPNLLSFLNFLWLQTADLLSGNDKFASSEWTGSKKYWHTLQYDGVMDQQNLVGPSWVHCRFAICDLLLDEVGTLA